MFDLDKWQEIFYTIRKNKLRTFLTAFSVSWGIFMLLLLMGAGSGLYNGLKHQFRDDAINSIWVYSGKTSIPYKGFQPGREIKFTNRDYDQIDQHIPGSEYVTGRFYLSGEYTVRYKNNYSSFNIRSCHPEHQYLERTIMTDGRYLNKKDLEERRKVAVVGSEVVKTLFKNSNPIGEWIDVADIRYRVVGVFDDEGSESEKRTIYIPITTAQMAYNGSDRLHQLMLTVGDATVEESKVIADNIKKNLANTHNFAIEDTRALRVWNNVEEFQRFTNLFEAIYAIIWFVGIMTIIAGIVGVSNIMLIVVKDRTREIGLRKALGATPFSIISLILQESITVTFLAGYTGLFFGVIVIEGVRTLLESSGTELPFFRNPEIEISTALYAVLLLVLAGAIAGFFPAYKAAKVEPIEALRDE